MASRSLDRPIRRTEGGGAGAGAPPGGGGPGTVAVWLSRVLAQLQRAVRLAGPTVEVDDLDQLVDSLPELCAAHRDRHPTAPGVARAFGHDRRAAPAPDPNVGPA